MLLNSLIPIISSLLLKILNPWIFLWSLFLTLFCVWFHFVIFHIFCTFIWFFILEWAFILTFQSCAMFCFSDGYSFTRKFSHALFLLGLFVSVECSFFIFCMLHISSDNFEGFQTVFSVSGFFYKYNCI